ncbi:hypothetical protein Tco_0308933 [Tanacetum coccineum]
MTLTTICSDIKERIKKTKDEKKVKKAEVNFPMSPMTRVQSAEREVINSTKRDTASRRLLSKTESHVNRIRYVQLLDEVFRNTLLVYETSKGSNGNIGLPNGFKDNDLVSVRSTSNKAKVLLINGGHSVSPNKALSHVAMSLKESISSANVQSCNRCPKDPNRCRDNKVDSLVCCNELERVYQQYQCAVMQHVC